jgi:hypothetical protein
MAIPITRAQYQAKFGSLPSVPDATQGAQPVQNTQPQQSSGTPIPITRAAYQAKFGQSPAIPNQQNQSQPQSGWDKALGVAKSVGNFLFPIVGDVGDDISGTSKKTFLQQTGDAALSVLPFIPGLGEEGEAVRGAGAAIEGAGDIADAAKGSGILSKFMGSTVAKGAATGYGAGVASNLSQGQGLGQAFMPNVNTIGGAVLGGAAPKIMDWGSSLIKSAAGLDPQMEEALSHVSPQERQRFIDAAKARTTNVRAPSPINLAADDLDKASHLIDNIVSQAGKAVGQAKGALGNVPIPDITPIAQKFTNRMADDYGLQLGVGADGKVAAVTLPNRTPPLAPSEQNRLADIYKDIIGLQGSTAQNGTDVLSKIRANINYAKGASAQGFDPLEQFFSETAAGLKDNVRSVAPDLAAANDRFENVKALQDEITKMRGPQRERGELMMKRIFSGDKGWAVNDLFGQIKNETGIDLTNSAVLAKHAVQVAGDPSQTSLLSQIMEHAASGDTFPKTIGEAAMKVGRALLTHTVANPESAGARAVSGKRALGGLLGSPYVTKAAIEAGSRASGLYGSIMPH